MPRPHPQLLHLASLLPATATAQAERPAPSVSLARWAEVQMLITAAVANEPLGG
ncbi:hypothetical protein [uncultured Abyssibacter sp.]|uniref:hypothetical protein n=1 Tax=uncultured Abyssibacter sp. TaxID=2320202 RepID=UPI0032B17510